MAKNKKVEKKVVNKQQEKQPQLFSQEELAHLLGMSKYQLDSLYSIRGIDRKTKMSLEEARKTFKNIV